MSKPLRSFFALVPDEAGIAFLLERMGLFRSRGWEKFGRFVAPGDIHLTLRFLGEIDEPTSLQLQAGAAEVARQTAPFTYTIERSVLFPRVSRARIIAAKVQPNEALQGLARALEQVCVKAGLPPEERLFRPHLTLARLRNQMKRPNLPGKTGSILQHPPGLFLLRTSQGSTADAYEEVARFSFAGPAA